MCASGRIGLRVRLMLAPTTPSCLSGRSHDQAVQGRPVGIAGRLLPFATRDLLSDAIGRNPAQGIAWRALILGKRDWREAASAAMRAT